MTSDSRLKKRVLDALDWAPELDAASIGVAVEDGVVSLTGHVRSYAEKHAAERAVKRVKGVRGLAEEIEVWLANEWHRGDDQVARMAVSALEWDVQVPHDRITVTVEDAVVTLEGEVERRFQRDAAERAVARLMGVRKVSNRITVEPGATPADVAAAIHAAFDRDAHLDARGIHLEIIGHKVMLRGAVDSWREREDAERLAWGAPGVAAVENELVVRQQPRPPADILAHDAASSAATD